MGITFMHRPLLTFGGWVNLRVVPQEYTSTGQLRYGHIMIMTDQDHDGSHIKGLLMNFLHHFFPSLLRVPGFLIGFITPIVKVGVHSTNV